MGILCSFAAARNCCCTASSSSGSLPFTGLRPRVACAESKPTSVAKATASTFRVRCRFQSVTPILGPRARPDACGNVDSAALQPYKKDRREIFMTDSKFDRCSLSAGNSSCFGVDMHRFPLSQQQAPEAAEVVQDAPAGPHM